MAGRPSVTVAGMYKRVACGPVASFVVTVVTMQRCSGAGVHVHAVDTLESHTHTHTHVAVIITQLNVQCLVKQEYWIAFLCVVAWSDSSGQFEWP